MTQEKSIFTMSFHRKVERLDWRKVASLDMDKVFHDQDWEQLQELLNQITFCRPESEFQEKTDPGFIKVFRIAQILIEYLVSSQDMNKTRAEKFKSRCQQLEDESKTYVEQVENLKQNLVTAKKELKKRKELLASTQSEVLGEENQNELDQCPYCLKRFMTATYLYAHMQRRHQGLPLQTAFPNPKASFHTFPNVGFPTAQSFPMVYTPGKEIKAAEITIGIVGTAASTQTERVLGTRIDKSTETINQEDKCNKQVVHMGEGENINDSYGNRAHVLQSGSNSPGIDLQQMSDLVEKYLEQKSIASQNQHYDKILSTIRAGSQNRDKEFLERRASISLEKNSSGDSSRRSSAGTVKPITISVEEATRSVGMMREELETQWHNIKEKVHESGIEELKEALLTEMQKMQELIVNSPRTQTDAKEVEQKKDDELKNMDERFRKQEEQLEQIKQSLQAKVELDIRVLETKLETQEEYWRSRLDLVETDYQKQLSKLREELHETSQKQVELQVQHEKHERMLESNEHQKETVNQIDDVDEMRLKETEKGVQVAGEQPNYSTENPNGESNATNANPPVPKPRQVLVPQSESAQNLKVVELPKLNKSGVDSLKPQRRLAPQPPPKQQKDAAFDVHEYEEPNRFRKEDESSLCSDSFTPSGLSSSETESDSEDIISKDKRLAKLPKQAAAKYDIDLEKNILMPIPKGQLSKAHLEKVEGHRKKAVSEMASQLKLQGVGPDDTRTILTKHDHGKILGKLKWANTATDDKTRFHTEDKSLQREVGIEVKKLIFQDEANKVRNKLNLPDPSEIQSSVKGRSQLSKILNAVKISGKWKKTGISQARKSPKKKKQSLKAFFSRVSWGGKSKDMPSKPKSPRIEGVSSDSEFSDDDVPLYTTSSRYADNYKKGNDKKKSTNDLEISNEKFDSDQSSNEGKVVATQKRTVQESRQNQNNGLSSRYVTVGAQKQSKPAVQPKYTQRPINKPSEIGHGRSLPVPDTKKSVNRDLLKEFEEAEEVKAMALISPIKCSTGAAYFGSDIDNSYGSNQSYNHQKLSAYSEEDDDVIENEKAKPHTSGKTNDADGMYASLRYPASTAKSSIRPEVLTSTPQKLTAIVSQPKPIHSQLFSSASAWDTESSGEEDLPSEKASGRIDNRIKEKPIVIPQVAPRLISKTSASPFIIRKTAPATQTQSNADFHSFNRVRKDSWD